MFDLQIKKRVFTVVSACLLLGFYSKVLQADACEYEATTCEKLAELNLVEAAFRKQAYRSDNIKRLDNFISPWLGKNGYLMRYEFGMDEEQPFGEVGRFQCDDFEKYREEQLRDIYFNALDIWGEDVPYVEKCLAGVANAGAYTRPFLDLYELYTDWHAYTSDAKTKAVTRVAALAWLSIAEDRGDQFAENMFRDEQFDKPMLAQVMQKKSELKSLYGIPLTRIDDDRRTDLAIDVLYRLGKDEEGV